MLVLKTNVLRLRNIPLLVICTLFIHGHRFTFKHLWLHSITKILRNGPRAHFPFSNADAHALVVAGEVAVATAALHAQVAAILNAKSLVPIVLDFTSTHYNRWRGLFLNTLERYALVDHVLSDNDHSNDTMWKRMGCTCNTPGVYFSSDNEYEFKHMISMNIKVTKF
jgi:hypothetical protein